MRAAHVSEGIFIYSEVFDSVCVCVCACVCLHMFDLRYVYTIKAPKQSKTCIFVYDFCLMYLIKLLDAASRYIGINA